MKYIKPLLNLFYLLVPLSIVMAFLWAPGAENLGHAGRIIFFHVPMAWLSTLAFIISGIYSIIFLYDKNNKYQLIEEKAHNSAVIGMTFLVMATISGSIWSKLSWGMFWNWDPRQTTIVVLLLIYIAYFSLRTSLSENPARGRLTSSYLIIAMVTAPFFVFIIPRLFATLHPDPILNPDTEIKLDGRIRITLMVSLAGFTLLFFYLYSLANRISGIRKIILKRNEDLENE